MAGSIRFSLIMRKIVLGIVIEIKVAFRDRSRCDEDHKPVDLISSMVVAFLGGSQPAQK
jgi:hypothetical protein